MMCVSVEIGEGAPTRRVRIIAPSIEWVLKIARAGTPGHRTRLVFPIEPEAFFVPEVSGHREAA
ncbi:MAG: hypothetical protein M3N18_00840 [Actinomycetota bacterium]|nr:hypothetical protein [Actinomycetota bacterium]